MNASRLDECKPTGPTSKEVGPFIFRAPRSAAKSCCSPQCEKQVRLTSKPRYLDLAQQCGRQILAGAEPGEPGLRWSDSGTDSKSNRYFGYAYGAAGIADVLLSLQAVSHDHGFRQTALQAAQWLAANIVPSGDDRVVVWPNTLSGNPVAPSWAKGSTGIGLFFLHAARERLLPQAEELALRSAHACASAPWLGSSLFQGLAGNIDFLLEMHKYIGEPWLLDSAWSLCACLLRLRANNFSEGMKTRGGFQVGAPAYLVGYAGVLAVLLRLLHPSSPRVVPGPTMDQMPLPITSHYARQSAARSSEQV